MIHLVFHALILRMFMGDPNLNVSLEDVSIKENLICEEVLVKYFDQQVNRLRDKEVTSVKVLWRSQQVKNATWEVEGDMAK